MSSGSREASEISSSTNSFACRIQSGVGLIVGDNVPGVMLEGKVLVLAPHTLAVLFTRAGGGLEEENEVAMKFIVIDEGKEAS